MTEIFLLLSMDHLKEVICVSRRWNNLGTKLHLWKKYEIFVNPDNLTKVVKYNTNLRRPINELMCYDWNSEDPDNKDCDEMVMDCRKVSLKLSLDGTKTESLVFAFQNIQELT